MPVLMLHVNYYFSQMSENFTNKHHRSWKFLATVMRRFGAENSTNILKMSSKPEYHPEFEFKNDVKELENSKAVSLLNKLT